MVQTSSKVNKMKCIFKKWQSFGGRSNPSYSNLTRNPSFNDASLRTLHSMMHRIVLQKLGHQASSSKIIPEQMKQPRDLRLYFGKRKRRYFVSAHYLRHPLLGTLTVERIKDGFSVACEVVLFDHLLWTLENADPETTRSDSSLEELTHFYVCN